MRTSPKNRRRLMWGGFCDDRLDTIEVDTGWGGFGTGSMARVPAIFTTQAEARKRFQDVRRVAIVPKPGRAG